MSSGKFDSSEKLYYSISEIAAELDVSTSLLRFWEKEFDLVIKKSGKGNRLYTKENLDRLQVIFHLVKEKGMTLQGAKNALQQKVSQPGDQDLLATLTRVRRYLENLKSQLDQ